jgi:hypothetical protein
VAREPLLNGPPEANKVWGLSEGDIILPGWIGKTWMDVDAIGRCSDDEWLLVEAWDES